jgi:hypothetical protein
MDLAEQSLADPFANEKSLHSAEEGFFFFPWIEDSPTANYHAVQVGGHVYVATSLLIDASCNIIAASCLIYPN